ncbi:MAG TPA: nascent polypeptide-associated complex protein [Alphaproteobacteria bacterium]|nr:nascent polypeptide-associated complex protein [Alphaproteobacteria bacterium]
MMPNINPRQMQQMMKKMGIQQEDIEALEVVIKCADKKIVISNPTVQKVNMMGNWSFQISGDESDEPLDSEGSDEPLEISDDDVKTVMDQTGGSKEDSLQALKDTNGNIAEAILLLTAEKED